MTTLAERPNLPLRFARTGLRIELGQQGGHGYAVTLEPDVARELAVGLLAAADQAEHDAAPVMDQLDDILRTKFDA